VLHNWSAGSRVVKALFEFRLGRIGELPLELSLEIQPEFIVHVSHAIQLRFSNLQV
jgi:hypothetical protein